MLSCIPAWSAVQMTLWPGSQLAVIAFVGESHTPPPPPPWGSSLWRLEGEASLVPLPPRWCLTGSTCHLLPEKVCLFRGWRQALFVLWCLCIERWCVWHIWQGAVRRCRIFHWLWLSLNRIISYLTQGDDLPFWEARMTVVKQRAKNHFYRYGSWLYFVKKKSILLL